MDFDFNEKEKLLFSDINNVLKDYSDFQDKESDILVIRSKMLDLIKRLSKTDYFKPAIDNNSDISLTSCIAAMEIAAAKAMSIFPAIELSVRLFGYLISNYTDNTNPIKNDLLNKINSGDIICSIAISEDSMNIVNDPFKTNAIIENDNIILSGLKNYVVNAPIADYFAVFGQMEEKNTIFIIKKDNPGLTINKRFNTIGYENMAISKIEFNRCKISKNYVIGPFADTEILDKFRMWENLILSASSLAMMQTSFEEAKEFSNVHRTGNKPIIAYQEIAFMLAEMLTLIQTARLLTYRAAWMMETNNKEMNVLNHCAKVFNAEASEKVASMAVQILSGKGFISGNKSESAFRNSKYCHIAGTSTEISRIKIGDSFLRLK